jgi:hypothetical protein
MPRPPIILDFITQTILREEYTSWSSILCSFLHACYTVYLTLFNARPRPTALLPPRSNGKTIGCYCS